jgi:DNA-binding NarL/FixJ family response regulator
MRRPKGATPMSMLTPAEQRLFALLTNGYTGREAAAKLGLSHRTVEVQSARMRERLGASTLVELSWLLAGRRPLTERGNALLGKE